MTVQDSARSRTFPPPLAFFFKRDLDPSDLKSCSSSPFDSAHVITALIRDPYSHPYLLNGRKLELNMSCAVAPDLGRVALGIRIRFSVSGNVPGKFQWFSALIAH